MEDLLRSKGLLRASVAQKRRGQNFLKDARCAQRIAQCCDVEGCLSSSLVVEIGAGAGALTRALLREGAQRIVAIESDARLAGFLRQWSEGLDEKVMLEIIEGDARTWNYAKLVEERGCEGGNAGGDNVVIVGNLPYSVGTVILRRLLEDGVDYSAMVLMFQREVAERITAKVGDTAYGRLSILVRLRCRVERCFDVAPRVFVPVPKVESCVLRFFPRREEEDVVAGEEYAVVAEMTGVLFAHRRKKMSTILRMAGRDDWERVGEEIGVDCSKRAEEVGVEEWLRWAREVRAKQRGRTMQSTQKTHKIADA